MVTRADAAHLLRRTEFVARPARVDALLQMTRDEAVDDVMAVPANPGSVTFTQSANWQRGQELVHYWLDRMAYAERPLQEKLALFWHGHFVSSLDKVEDAHLMREQIDLYRRDGLGNLRDLAIAMSTQVAMLRYLDNNQNKRTSPNQNFGRELMELFLLGVGNYTERDVEANTAAWTGHGDQWDTDEYVWRGGDPSRPNWRERSDNWHDYRPKQFLGRTINNDSSYAAGPDHGPEAIRTILGNGIVPVGATNVANRKRPTRDVAAEFISRKLWTFFAGTPIPDDVLDDLRDTAVANDFAIRPWVRALLLRPEFYSTGVKRGLVRSPVDYMVALLAATGLASAQATPAWLMQGMGQALLYPPNVSGWKHNGYYISASAFDARVQAARQMMWRTQRTYWDEGGVIRLAGGTISKAEVEATSPWTNQPAGRAENAARRRALADKMVQLMQIDIGDSTRAALHAFASASEWWELNDLVGLIFMCPEMHVA
ncbi:MAG TPA: DUF1800 family protein [Ilumatobacter sp.]|nr:DUF1800 family protein [Ilumatobacter sp.]